MTRFRNLLRADPSTTPKAEQESASLGLADAVAGSRMRWSKSRSRGSDAETFLLLVIAPYSRYDLALLDLIDEALADDRAMSTPIYVGNLRDYTSADQLQEDFPGLAPTNPTPLVAVWEHGTPTKIASGKSARDLIAERIGVAAEALHLQIAEVARRHAPS